ncbi:MAG: carbamoyltransferase HypF [Caldilineaceae bacterium]|nr:carbamoyltransferase HypF [Caldilineaceae bacterium]
MRVTGVVQGVGFRPFVYGLATRLQLAGCVGNDSAGVFIEIEGPPTHLDAFQQTLVTTPPPLAFIDNVTVTPRSPTGEQRFLIEESQAQPNQHTLIAPDVALCADCRRELFDPNDRRYRYPFINCTNCGPRFTIIEQLPYDRPLTTMAAFALCPVCQREYDDPLDRRFHAQPVACPRCGPQLEFLGKGETGDGRWETGEGALGAAQELLRHGGIVAVKGLGGFHLACDATNEAAVQALRQRKGRVDKPFAVMVRELAVAHQFAQLAPAEEALLTSRERPIILVAKREQSPLAAAVAPGNPKVGLMLPYTPLHELLFSPSPSHLPAKDTRPLPTALVMTSGNFANEPMVKENDAALTKLSPLADGFLLHNRPIAIQCDDSVIRVFEDHELPIRRSRGYAPLPLRLPRAVQPTLGVGGELKNTFCLAADQAALMSQHIGDMENLETLQAFEQAVSHFQATFAIQPTRLACDQHPGYLSSRWAREAATAIPLVQVQHHHAHLAGVMAEHGLDGSQPVIGFCFDGTGYGTDGAIWGGEVLLADYRGFHRRAHLRYIPLPGGDAAVKYPCRTALAHLWTAGLAWEDDLPAVAATTATEQRILQRQFAHGFQTVPSSSMGRLFDAVAALAGVRQVATYEAQAAIELEARAAPTEQAAYAFGLAAGSEQFDAAPIIQAIVQDLRQQVPTAQIAARFHHAVAELILQLSLRIRQEEKLTVVALSGGVFQNGLLLQLAATRLRAAGFQLLTHRLTPPNDGGLALGQVMIANAQEGA